MVTSTTKPNILIVPGAWHPSAAYHQFAEHLEISGYPTLTATLPSVGSSSPKAATCTEDADALRGQLLSLIESDGKDVLVLAHSYGGIPAAGAAYGLSKSSRRQEGKKGGVLGLIYLSAFVVPEGTSLLTYLGGKHAPYLVPDDVRLSFSNLP